MYILVLYMNYIVPVTAWTIDIHRDWKQNILQILYSFCQVIYVSLYVKEFSQHSEVSNIQYSFVLDDLELLNQLVPTWNKAICPAEQVCDILQYVVQVKSFLDQKFTVVLCKPCIFIPFSLVLSLKVSQPVIHLYNNIYHSMPQPVVSLNTLHYSFSVK